MDGSMEGLTAIFYTFSCILKLNINVRITYSIHQKDLIKIKYIFFNM